MHLSLFLLENKLLKWSSFTGAFFWKNMIYKNLLRIAFAFPVSPKF